MIGRIVVIIINIALILYSFQSTLWLRFLQNVPYIGMVADVVENFLGVSGMVPSFSPSQSYSEEFVKALVFTGLYSPINKAVRKFCSVTIGKHAADREFRLSLNNLIIGFLGAITSAVATSYAMEFVYLKLVEMAASHGSFLGAVVHFTAVAIILLAAFIFFGRPIIEFALWVLTMHIIPTAMRIVCVELYVIFMYCLLNIPGMMEHTMTIAIMLVGMVVCFGAVFATELYEGNMQKNWTSGSRYR